MTEPDEPGVAFLVTATFVAPLVAFAWGWNVVVHRLVRYFRSSQ